MTSGSLVFRWRFWKCEHQGLEIRTLRNSVVAASINAVSR